MSVILGLALLGQDIARAQAVSVAPAQGPSGGSVVKGNATITQTGANTVIDQSSAKAVIDWRDFSVGSDASVRFNQLDSSSIILNRVTGSNPSNILGNLSANGQVFLVNPFGVYFGAGAAVDVGGLVASTLNISNDDFMAGRYAFNRGSLSTARREVINAGVLKARDSGYIVLAGDYAANRGVVQAKLGTVALASGSKMTLDINGDSLINFSVNEKTVANLAGVENSGQMLADGGRAIMTASTANDMAAATVNNSGLIRARSTVERNGEIYLSADGGNAEVSGTLDASGKDAGRKGGRIDVLGNKVALIDAAMLDVSGNAGGGTVHVGGNFQGKGPLPNSRTAYVGKDVNILADALGNGNGGKVVVWSDDLTRYYGHISAQGGARGGDGGNVEVSGKAVLGFNGTVNTLAAHGKTGNLLLDPADIEILSSVAAGTGDITASSPYSDATNNGGTSRITVGAVETALGSGNVTITTHTTSGTAPKSGTITLDDGSGGGLQWNTGNTLHLKADSKIVINSDIGGPNGILWLEAGGGAAQKAGTTIGAKSLLISGTGNWDLAGVGSTNFINSYNQVGTFAANISGGLLRFSNNTGFTVGTVSGVSGITHTNGNTQLYADRNNGVLTLAQNIKTSTLYMRASGGVNQTGGTVKASTVGFAGGGVTLNQSGNNVGTISANINGAFSYTDADTLTVGGLFGVNGITTSNHDITLVTGDAAGYDKTKLPDGTNPASLTLNQVVNAGTGNIKLTVGSGGVYQRHDIDSSTSQPDPAGSLTASNLLLLGTSSNKVTPFILTNADNLVTTLAASLNGSLSYTGGPLTIGTVGGVNGITTTSNTIVVPATTDSQGRPVPDVYNENNVALSIGGDIHINQNINAATTTGPGSVSIGMGGDFTASTASGKRIDANTLGVFGDDNEGTFNLVVKTSALAAGGGKVMWIDNSAQTGDLTGIGIGAPATQQNVSNGGSSVDVDSAAKPVGDFYLTTGGALNIIKLISQGENLMLRADSLSVLLDATTADGARIMLQPYHTTNKIGINNSVDGDFTADTNYSADTLLKFVNPTATFFFGTPQNTILSDSDVLSAAKNTFTGNIHIGSDGAFNLGYRSISAQTSGSMVVHNAGPLYNLRLAAPNLTINGFNTFGDQIHFFSNNLQLPGAAANYINPNKPTITLRPLNDETVWVGLAPGSKSRPDETQILSAYIVKLPDGSTIVISGSTDFPFPSGGPGYGDIHVPWNDTLGASLGNRKLVFSTGTNKVYTYGPTPNYTKKTDGGKSGGLWQGCQDLTTCQGTNPDPYATPTTDNTDNGNDNNNNNNDNTTTVDVDNGCPGCPPAPPNTNPYPPDTTTTTVDTGTNGNTGTNTNNNNNTNTNNNNGLPNDGGDGGGGTGGGGPGDNTNNNNNNNNGNNGNNGANDGGDGGGGTGGGGPGGNTNNNNNNNNNGNNGNNGSNDGGDGGGGTGGGGPGGNTNNNNNNGNGTGGDGNGNGTNNGGVNGGGDGGGGTGNGGNGNGTGNGGNGNGDGGAGSGNGTGGDGTGGGDGGAGTGNGGAGNGNGNGNGGAGNGNGNGGNGNGNGNGDGGAGTGNGTGGDGTGGGDGGAGTGNGGAGNGNGNGNGGAGNGNGNGGNGNGNGNGDGGAGTGNGTGGDGNGGGDGGAGTGNGGAGNGNGNGNGGNGNGNGGNGNGDGNGDGGAGTGNGTGGDGNGGGDGGAGTGSGGVGDGNGGAGNGNGNGGNGNGDGNGDGGAGTGTGGDGNGGGDGGAGTGSGGVGDGNGDTGNGKGNGNGGDGDGGGDGGAGTGSGGAANGGIGNGDDNGSGAGDGSADAGGDAGSATADGGASDGSSSADTDGGEPSGIPAFDLGCSSVSAEQDNQEEKNSGDQNSALIEVNRSGVKMRDPCEEEPQQKSKNGKR